MLRALLLDLDDTLFDRRRAFEACMQGLARAQLGRALYADELAALHLCDGRGHKPRSELAREAATLGLQLDPQAFGHALAEHVEPEPAVRETLALLARTRRLAIVTNGGAAQRTKLARLGLADVVRTVFVSGELGFSKPDRRVFEHALRWSECAPGEVLFVGDEPVIDLAPAAALGMATAWRVRGEWPAGQVGPTYRITSIAELVEVCGR